MIKELSKDIVDFLLSKEDYFPHSQEEIKATLSDSSISFEDKVDYIKALYDDAYTSFFLFDKPENGYVGYKKEDTYLHLWKGNYLTRTEDTHVPYYKILVHQQKKLGIPIDKITDTEIKKVIQSGSTFVDGKFRIYKKFMEEKSINILSSFLKNEYGIGGYCGDRNHLDTIFDASGIVIQRCFEDETKITLKWNQVASLIRQLIDKGEYLNKKELIEYQAFLNDIELNKIASLTKDVPVPLYGSIYEKRCLIETSVGKKLLENAVENAGAEFKKTADRLKTLNPLRKNPEPYWSKTDWNLKRAAESKTVTGYKVEKDDIIIKDGRKHTVVEIEDKNFFLQDNEFPIFMKCYSELELIDILFEAGIQQPTTKVVGL